VPGHQAGRYALGVGSRRHVPSDHGASANQRPRAHVDAAEHDRARPYGGASRDDCPRRLPSPPCCRSPETFVAHGSSLTNITPWPTTTSSWISTPSPMKVWLSVVQRAPTDAPRWISTNGPMRVSAPMRHPYKLVNGAILGAGADVHVGQQAVGRHCDRGRRPLVVHAEHSARAVCVSRDHRFVAPRAVAFRDCHTRMRAYGWLRDDPTLVHRPRTTVGGPLSSRRGWLLLDGPTCGLSDAKWALRSRSPDRAWRPEPTNL
jgi:hypothetical protein